MANLKDPTRKFVVDKIDTLVEFYPRSRNIEIGIYNYSIKKSRENHVTRKWDNIEFKNIYMNKVRSIYTNLKKDSYVMNNELLDKLKSGEIKSYDLAYLKNHEIFTEFWKNKIDEKMKRDQLLYEMKPESMTDLFKCGKCKKRECSYYEVQTRSADEPMTVFVSCLNCKNRWKQ